MREIKKQLNEIIAALWAMCFLLTNLLGPKTWGNILLAIAFIILMLTTARKIFKDPQKDPKTPITETEASNPSDTEPFLVIDTRGETITIQKTEDQVFPQMILVAGFKWRFQSHLTGHTAIYVREDGSDVR